MPSTHTNLLFHIVYSTKYRRSSISSQIQPRLYDYIGGIVREQKGVLLKIGGIADHIHLLAKLSPTSRRHNPLFLVRRAEGQWGSQLIPGR